MIITRKEKRQTKAGTGVKKKTDGEQYRAKREKRQKTGGCIQRQQQGLINMGY